MRCRSRNCWRIRIRMPSAKHCQSGAGASFGTTQVTQAANTGSTGGNAAMNIMQPFAVVKMIISY